MQKQSCCVSAFPCACSARNLLWIYRFLKPTQFPIGQTSRNVAIDVILDLQDQVFICITHNTHADVEKMYGNTCAEEYTELHRSIYRNTQKNRQKHTEESIQTHSHKTMGRLPNQKLQVIWASHCVWVDARQNCVCVIAMMCCQFSQSVDSTVWTTSIHVCTKTFCSHLCT